LLLCDVFNGEFTISCDGPIFELRQKEQGI
jgi:hypothetical protein